MKHKIVKFEDAIKEFTFSQFYEICKIFEVEVVDRDSIRQATLEATQNKTQVDMSKVKFRRDFDEMGEELCKKYHSYGRENRRKIDRIVAKIVWGNKQADRLAKEKVISQYDEGLAYAEQLPEFQNNTDMAASPTEEE